MTESSSEFSNKFEKVVNKLRSVGEIVASKTELRYLLMKLPPSKVYTT